jgi:hypothetical protein
MGLPRATTKRDGFGCKTSAFLDLRNERLCAAASALSGAVVALDSPALGTLRALKRGGISPSRIHVINRLDELGFSRKARRLGATPHVCDFGAIKLPCAALYYDGTRGDPLNARRELAPWLTAAPLPKYLSFTAARRCNTYMPDTTRVHTQLDWLASRGFAPVGGWGKVSTAVTRDSKVYNLSLQRGGGAALALGDAHGGGRFALSPVVKVPRELSRRELRARLERLHEASPTRPRVMCSQGDAVVARWEQLRRQVCGAGRGAERELRGLDWMQEDYRRWLSKEGCKAKLERSAGTLEEAVAFHLDLMAERQGSAAAASSVLCVLDLCTQPRLWLEWLRRWLPPEALARSACTGDGDANAAVTASCTRGLHHPARSRRQLAEARGDRFRGAAWGLVVVAVTSPEVLAYEDALAKVEEAAARVVVREGAALLVSLRTEDSGATLDWILRVEERLHELGLRRVVAVDVDERHLEDRSGLASLLVARRR